jgi:hypothetical protein
VVEFMKRNGFELEIEKLLSKKWFIIERPIIPIIE